MSLRRRLSDTLGQLKRGFWIDSRHGKADHTQVLVNVPAASTTAVHAAITLTTAAQTITSAITSPAHPRNITVSGNQGDVYANVTIKGLNYAGENIQETILASGTTLGVGTKPFASVSKILVPARTATGQTVAIGCGVLLGLDRPIDADSDVLMVERRASGSSPATFLIEATGTVDEDEGTLSPTGGITANDSFKIHYKSTFLG